MKKKLILCVLMVVVLSTTGCGAKSSKGSSVAVNMIKKQMNLSKVSFYDFYWCRRINSVTWDKCVVLTDPINDSTEIEFKDPNGNTRVFHIDQKLKDRPSDIKVFLNEYETEFDTYKISY